MKQLDIYVAKTVGMTMLMAELGLLGILTIFTFLEQVEDIENNYALVNVIQFVIYSMPRMFYEVIPYSALIGCLAGLGLLANNSEIVVMRAAGISTWSLSASAMKPTIVLVLVGLAVGEYVLPDVERIARNDRLKALSSKNQITPQFGFWYREGNIFMHFDEVGQDGSLEGISHYYFNDENEMTRSLFAKNGIFYGEGTDQSYWQLEDVIVTDFHAGNTEASRIASVRWDSTLAPELLSTEILVQPDKMSISELSDKIDYMREQGLNSGKFELGFWKKVLQPLATIGLVFVAISFIFGPLRESTMGMRVVMGLVIGILFKFVQDLLSPASMVFGFSPIIAILIPILICFLVGYPLMRKAS
jgi:lipopolysaccharide export system permease protein